MPNPFADRERAPRLLGPDDSPPEGSEVWLFEGTLERVIGGAGRYTVRQRVAWCREPDWEEVREFGVWMVERLSINGHLLIGLRAWPEAQPDQARRIDVDQAA